MQGFAKSFPANDRFSPIQTLVKNTRIKNIMTTKRFIKTILFVAPIAALTTAGLWLWHQSPVIRTIEQLLTENTALKQSITHLTDESQIGYAKVLSQETRDGQLYTRVLFVETKPNEPLKPVLRREYTIAGDVVHFDALIVKFGQQMVMNGEQKAIYLWRRVYGEYTEPNEGFAINPTGVEPARYQCLGRNLNFDDRQLFWDHIWDLANDPNQLKTYGIDAVYGSVVYHKLVPGLIYVFKINSTGTLYPEVVPDL